MSRDLLPPFHNAMDDTACVELIRSLAAIQDVLGRDAITTLRWCDPGRCWRITTTFGGSRFSVDAMPEFFRDAIDPHRMVADRFARAFNSGIMPPGAVPVS